ncbi:MAG TPA: hypothetical protein VM198_02835 [Longimicrobiales bacterium]|nr:hypothetical protein [Longimicrobiales bacterium]
MSESEASSDSPPEPAARLARQIVEAGGGAVRAVLLYGSQLLHARPDGHSAYDLVVIVDDYRRFYAALHTAGELPRPVGVMTAMAHLLPPNVIAFAPGQGREGIAKCQITSREHFARALGPEPPDHFVLGRMVQRVEAVWSAGAEDTAWVEGRLAGARSRVLTWMAPYLEGPFDAEGLGRRLLEVCYRGELRPEAKDRADTIFEAQADHFRSAFPAVLEQGVADGVLEREPSSPAASAQARYRLARPSSSPERRRWRRHFARSKARATARWFKHMITFANWLPYIVRKVERHTGRAIELTSLERKLPIVFLWPRAIRVLLSRPEGESARNREARKTHREVGP